MTHYRTLLDPGVFVHAGDFEKDKTVQISRVVREKMPVRDGDKEEQAGVMCYFSSGGKELARKYKCPRSVLYGLSLTYGTNVDEWIGKDVTLFAAKCLSFGATEECVRIRFTPEVDASIRKWLKKRKASPSAYMITDQA